MNSEMGKGEKESLERKILERFETFTLYEIGLEIEERCDIKEAKELSKDFYRKDTLLIAHIS
ncbi:MAG TPA: hypothetical protein EYG91_04260 [Aquifex aeolicus]|nr:hypothetical protein [Aquifex aeolicus]